MNPSLEVDVTARARRRSVDVEVRFADDDVVVVAKPAGLVVHPGAGHVSGTLVNGLLARFPGIESVGDPHPARASCIASTATRADCSRSRCRARRTTRSSRSWRRAPSSACTSRSSGADLSSPRGMIDAPIGRSGARRTRMAVRRRGQAGAHRVPRRRGVRRTAVQPGRVQARDRAHAPDPRAPRRDRASRSSATAPTAGRATQIPLARPFLHAATLGFDHPGTGEAVRFEEPLPPELQAVLDASGRGRQLSASWTLAATASG